VTLAAMVSTLVLVARGHHGPKKHFVTWDTTGLRLSSLSNFSAPLSTRIPAKAWHMPQPLKPWIVLA